MSSVVRIWLLVILVAIGSVGYINHALAEDTKNLGDCGPSQTEGRCADKCPVGSYSIGINKEGTGDVCKANPTGCPYGDSIPLGPDCDRQAPKTLDAVTTVPNVAVPQYTNDIYGGGK